MPFLVPSASELRDRIRGDMIANLPQIGQVPRRSMIDVFVKVQAGAQWLAYEYLDWIALQVFPDTAEGENLERWGTAFSVARKDAVFAEGTATLNGTMGATVPVGTLLQRSDGFEYVTHEEGVIGAAGATVKITSTDAAAAASLDPGQSLQLVSALADIDTLATVQDSTQNGADRETDDLLKQRVLLATGNKGLAGKADDYLGWTLEMAGVTKAWVFANINGPGTVGVNFLVNDGLPDANDVIAMQAHLANLVPLGAQVLVLQAVYQDVDFTLHVEPDTTEVRAAVQAELVDLLDREGDPGQTIPLTHVHEAISGAPGEDDHQITDPVAGIPVAVNAVPRMGVLTWV